MNSDKLKTLFTVEDLYILSGIILIFLTVYFAVAGLIKSSRMANDQKRRTLSHIRALFILVGIISIMTLWATELYQFIISIAALMAGMAIASKEVLLCIGGSFYKAFARPFSVGNRVEINGIRGDVVDVGLLSTQLLEVGPKDYTQQLTGRMITIPNSLFLSCQIFNETDAVTEHQDFVLHIIKVPIEVDYHWEEHKDCLLNSANESCEKYVDPARKFFSRLSKKRQVDIPLIEPRINIKFDGPNKILLMLRVCVPVDKRGTIEQEIMRNYLKRSYISP